MSRKQSQPPLALERDVPIHLVASTRGHSTAVWPRRAVTRSPAGRQLGALYVGLNCRPASINGPSEPLARQCHHPPTAACRRE